MGYSIRCQPLTFVSSLQTFIIFSLMYVYILDLKLGFFELKVTKVFLGCAGIRSTGQ